MLVCLTPLQANALAPSRYGAWFWRNASFPQGQAQPNLNSVPGYIHVPSAHSLNSSELWLVWSNHSERGPKTIHAHNIHFAVGVLPGLTLAGRISGQDYNHNTSSDLSVHVHWKVPWIPRRWFDLALGAQDLGGAVSYYKGYYAIVSRDLGPLQLSFGWGLRDATRTRRNGMMAALAWRPLSFLGFSAEWDASALNAGIRLSTPPRWLWGAIKLGAQASVHELSKAPKFYASGFMELSLASSPGRRRAQAQPFRSPRGDRYRNRYRISAIPRIPSRPTSDKQAKVPKPKLATIYQALAALDLERIQLTSTAEGLRICVENAVFERSGIDAIGVVLGIASNTLDQARRVELSITKHGIPLMTVATRAGAFARMIQGGPTSDKLVRVQSGQTSPCPHASHSPLSPFGRPRLSLSPAISMTAATELGYWDGHIGARWGLDLPLAFGSNLRLRYEHGLWSTQHFERTGIFAPIRLRSGFREAALHQALPLAPGLFALLSLGIFDFDQWTAGLNLDYQRGLHRLGFFGSVYTRKFNRAHWVGLGRYRVEWPGGPIAMTLTAGQFPDQSRGLRVALDFAWGDTLFSGYARYGEIKAVGMGITVPLAPRKNRIFGQGPARIILSSAPAFSQALHTRVGQSHNALVGPAWLHPGTAAKSFATVYSEGGRLTESRVSRAQRRMRDAYHRYITRASMHPKQK